MELTVLDPHALDAGDAARWRALARAAVEPNPFFEPEVLLPALQHLAPEGVRLAVVREGDEWTACVPVRRQARLGRLPGPCLVAWQHPHAYLGTPLVRHLDGARTLARELADRAGAGWLGLPELNLGGPVADALCDAAGPDARLTAVGERAALHRRPDGRYLGALAPKRRRELARQARALALGCGGPLSVADVAGERRGVEAFLDLEHAGWKGAHGTSLRAVDGHADFFSAMCTALAAAGRLQLLEMRAGDRLVAMKCNLLAGDGAFCFKIAYAEDLKRYSPGVQLEVRNVDVFHATDRLAFSDSCAAAGNTMINRLWPDRRAIAMLVVPRGAVARRVLPTALRLREERRRRRDFAA